MRESYQPLEEYGKCWTSFNKRFAVWRKHGPVAVKPIYRECVDRYDTLITYGWIRNSLTILALFIPSTLWLLCGIPWTWFCCTCKQYSDYQLIFYISKSQNNWIIKCQIYDTHLWYIVFASMHTREEAIFYWNYFDDKCLQITNYLYTNRILLKVPH